jgi:hypothetical protein
MDINKLLKLAHFFQSLAESEELPADSKDLKTILKNLEGLETYTARKEYAEKNLEHLSSGSSRIVYLTPDKTVVKMAKNDKGIAQNEVECNPKMKSKFINEIISCAKNHSWLETHYLDKITTKDFKEMTGLDFDDFGEALRYGLKSTSEKPKGFDKVADSEVYKEMKRLGEKFDLLAGDIARISSWGTKDGRPILIDAGLTEEVFDEYYDSSSS